VTADVRALQAQPEARGALFQVASQFNLLEMTSPDVTPEHGVAIYQHDPTQGPACAVAAGPGTIYRNDFADTGAGLGPTGERQVDTLRDLARALFPEGVPMRNGDALPSRETLDRVTAVIEASDPGKRDRLLGLLRIGLHREVEVTAGGAHRVPDAARRRRVRQGHNLDPRRDPPRVEHGGWARDRRASRS
jgi:hypothetical protein